MPKGISERNQGGWHHRQISIEKMITNRIGKTANEKNPRWRGDKVSYGALHTWIKEHYGKPTKCEECLTEGLTGGKIHWANVSGKYKRDRSDWKRLCAKCHKLFDKNRKQNEYKNRKRICKK